MMKKIISALVALILVVCISCAAFAETAETELSELGYNKESDFDFEKGNFFGVTCDGSVRAKIYLTNDFLYDEATQMPGTALWMRDTGIENTGDDAETETFWQNVICTLETAETLGATTLEEIVLDEGYEGEIVTVNGVKALLFNSSDKYVMGGIYELDEGFLMIIISGVVNEDLENEAVITLCSLTTEE